MTTDTHDMDDCEAAFFHLKNTGRQADADGIEIIVSREALVKTLRYVEHLILEVENLEYQLKQIADLDER
jgi:hypothetical protein